MCEWRVRVKCCTLVCTMKVMTPTSVGSRPQFTTNSALHITEARSARNSSVRTAVTLAEKLFSQANHWDTYIHTRNRIWRNKNCECAMMTKSSMTLR